jgi:hypothetical protein
MKPGLETNLTPQLTRGAMERGGRDVAEVRKGPIMLGIC